MQRQYYMNIKKKKDMESAWTLLFCVILSLSLCRAQGSGCTVSRDLQELRQLRLEQLKSNILAQLGLTEVPPPPPADLIETDLDQETLQNFYQLENDSSAAAAIESKKCTSGEFFAKPINSFVGIISSAEELLARRRRGVDSDKDEQEVLTSSDNDLEGIKHPDTLNQYTITVNFNLPRNQSDISRAHLILYQEEANTIDHEVLDRYQLVQIKTVVENVRYPVEKKAIDVSDSGDQSFDITSALEVWVAKGVSGTVLLEVVVTCSVPNCNQPAANGNPPAKVSFAQDAADINKQPRIIVVSKNPLEEEHYQSRRKRQARINETEYMHCTETESTCCLQPLEINFLQDLGIDFVWKPKTFQANFCEGYCPEVSGLGLMTSQRHELLRYISSTPTSQIEPCCSGIEYRPLQVLLKLYNTTTGKFNTRMDRLDQVIVTKCRCA